jgi:sortase A
MTDASLAAPHRGGDLWRLFARGLGQLLITAGVLILLFVAYELGGTGVYTEQQQSQEHKQLEQQWAHPSTGSVEKVRLGHGLAILYIPRLGRNYHFVVVEGTGFTDLQKGPGHYPGTALPGGVGNFAVAGHRTTYLHPFNRIDKLRSGDSIVLETRDKWFTYTVEDIPGTSVPWREIVDPTQVEVAFPVPDQPDPSAKPTLKLLTFTSCNPKYSAAQRIVVHAMLTDERAKSLGLPPALVKGRVSV